MSPFAMFLLRIPLVLAGLAVLATGMIYISALPAVQMQLAQVSTE